MSLPGRSGQSGCGGTTRRAILLACVVIVWGWAWGLTALAQPPSPPPPQTPPPTSLRLAVVADTHLSGGPDREANRQRFEQVVREVNAADVDAVLLAGDLTTHGLKAGATAFKEVLGQLEVPAYLVPGNHDVGNKPMPGKPTSLSDQRIAAYEAQFGRSFYAVDLMPGVRLVAINSLLTVPGLKDHEAQWAMLEDELGERRDRQVILLMHYPSYVEDVNEPGQYFNLDPEPRRRLLSLIERGGVTLVVSGHLHRPRVIDHQGTTMVTAPAVSFGLPRPTQREGWTLLELTPRGEVSVEHRWLRQDALTTAATATRPNPRPATRPVMSAATRPDATSGLAWRDTLDTLPAATRRQVHAFYYPWYGTPEHDGQWVHWDQNGQRPADTFAAPTRPRLGLYSSNDPAVIDQHVTWAAEAGIDTLVVSWWGLGSFEDRATDRMLDRLAARPAPEKRRVQLTLHVEPYEGRTPGRALQDLGVWLERHGEHPSLASWVMGPTAEARMPVYVYDVLREDAQAWRAAIKAWPQGLRERVWLLGQTSDAGFIAAAGFDGGYNYDGVPAFENKQTLTTLMVDLPHAFAQRGLVFVPCIAPGYDDDRATGRLDNEPAHAQSRDGGTQATYRRAWGLAARHRVQAVAITSFNEWHEGTSVEPCERWGDQALQETARGITAWRAE